MDDDEDKGERLDRELVRLLNELRGARPSVQVIFAFLLTVPFTNRFQQVNDLQKDTFLLALICTALGLAFLMAPSAYHRIRFREHDKERMLRTSNRLALAGTVFLAVAITASVFFVTDFLFQMPLPGLLAAVVAGVIVWFWYGLPLLRKIQDYGSGAST